MHKKEKHVNHPSPFIHMLRPFFFSCIYIEYFMNACAPKYSYVEDLTSNVYTFAEGLSNIIETKWNQKWGLNLIVYVVFVREDSRELLAAFPLRQDADIVGEPLPVNQEVLPQDANQQALWSWTSYTPELSEINFCFLSYIELYNLWCFLMTSYKQMTLKLDISTSLEDLRMWCCELQHNLKSGMVIPQQFFYYSECLSYSGVFVLPCEAGNWFGKLCENCIEFLKRFILVLPIAFRKLSIFTLLILSNPRAWGIFVSLLVLVVMERVSLKF